MHICCCSKERRDQTLELLQGQLSQSILSSVDTSRNFDRYLSSVALAKYVV